MRLIKKSKRALERLNIFHKRPKVGGLVFNVMMAKLLIEQRHLFVLLRCCKSFYQLSNDMYINTLRKRWIIKRYIRPINKMDYVIYNPRKISHVSYVNISVRQILGKSTVYIEGKRCNTFMIRAYSYFYHPKYSVGNCYFVTQVTTMDSYNYGYESCKPCKTGHCFGKTPNFSLKTNPGKRLMYVNNVRSLDTVLRTTFDKQAHPNLNELMTRLKTLRYITTQLCKPDNNDILNQVRERFKADMGE